MGILQVLRSEFQKFRILEISNFHPCFHKVIKVLVIVKPLFEPYSTFFQGKQVQAGEVVNPGDVLDLNENAKALRKAHTRLKLDVEKYMGELSNVIGKMGPAFKQLKNSEKGTMEEIEEVRALYRKEALQRKLLYNQVYATAYLTRKAPIATKVFCFSRLLKCLRSLFGKQCGPRSDCSYRSSLFWVHAVCFYT